MEDGKREMTNTSGGTLSVLQWVEAKLNPTADRLKSDSNQQKMKNFLQRVIHETHQQSTKVLRFVIRSK